MKYSIIIPAYQCAEKIERTVRSVQNANFQDYEIVIVDDGSSDGTFDVCRRLSEDYPEIKVLKQENLGVSVARNYGLQEAKGEFVLFVDADDELMPFDPQKLDKLLSDEIDMLIFGMEFRYFKADSCLRTETHACSRELTLTLETVSRYFAELFANNALSSSCNKFIRRAMLTNYGTVFNPKLINYEDLEFSVNALSRCRKIVVLPDVQYVYYLAYGQDRTIERVQRIPDVIKDVDLIAESLFLLNDRFSAESECEDIMRVTLQIYFDMFLCKMKTASVSVIQKHCVSFRENGYIHRCLPHLQDMSAILQRVYQWIQSDRVLTIWFYFRYRKVRNTVVRMVKRILRWY